MTKLLVLLFRVLAALYVFPVLFLCFVVKNRRKELLWGPTPIISNKYWSRAMRDAGWDSKTLMYAYIRSINQREDYDLLFEDVVPRWVFPRTVGKALADYFALLYMIQNASAVHLPFSGGPLGETRLWRLEAYLFRRAGIRTVVMAYGADAYMYSRVSDPSLRHGLLLSYPRFARTESQIARRVRYWAEHADIILCGPMIDGMSRWDVPMFSVISIDTEEWTPKPTSSWYNGTDGPVKVIHTPNHRGFKGTEFLVQAVEELKAEGLKVELVLLEGVQNSEVRRLMQEADILAEQFIQGYALSAIEGMASGLPVMSNLESEHYTRAFRRYAFLNECPIVSTSPETLKRNLRALVTDPALREQLGRAGRQYVEKYHSYETARYLFGSIYEKILGGKDVDLMNLFHPLKSEYNRRRPLVEHPLVESRLPPHLLERARGAGDAAPAVSARPLR
jgi:glycosyltransferase involved in cell wall biosynthesis